MEADEFETKTAAFLQWLSEVGVKTSPKMRLVDLRSEGRGRGIVALADFEEDEIVFSIPRSAVINLNTALDNVETDFLQAILHMPKWLTLTGLILYESLRKASKWAPYFAVLPRRLDSLVFWSEPELAELQASTVVNKIGKREADEMFSQLVDLLGLKNGDADMCHRIASIIMAYAFDIPEEKTSTEKNSTGDVDGEDLVSDDGEDEKAILSMIPLADMLNADGDRNNARLSCDNEDLEMRTIKPIMKGEEIFNDYGQLPRSDLLRRYGYVTNQYAVYDVAEISTSSILSAFRITGSLNIPNLEPLSSEGLQERVELAEREGVLEDSYDLVHSGPEEPSIPDELLALLYLLLADNENLKAISSSQTSLPSRSKLATELVGQVLATLLTTREREYSTAIEEDKKLLEAGNLSNRMAMAIQVRLGEKEVLREAIQETASFIASNKRMRLPQTDGADSTTHNGRRKRRTDRASSPTKKGRFR